MSESSEALRSSNGRKSNGDQLASSKMKLPRRSLVVFISILLLFLGWGGWRFYGKLKISTDRDASAEFDGIELVTPLFESGQSSPTSGLGESDSISTKTGRNRRNASRVTSAEYVSTSDRASHSDVWLTGTIEFDESEERKTIPQRISGGPNDSSARR